MSVRYCTFKFSLTESESESEVAQSCLTLCDSVDCSPPGSSVHGILQARILEWIAISFSRGIFPGIEPRSPTLQANALTSEPPGKPPQCNHCCVLIYFIFIIAQDDLLWWLSSKESNCNAGDMGLIPGSGRSPGGWHGNPFQDSCLESPLDRGAW